MRERIERWASIVVGAAVVLLVAWVTFAEAEHRGKAPRRVEAEAGTATVGSSTSTSTSTSTSATASAEPGGLDAGLGFLFDASIGLPSGAPRTVHLGVVLVQFLGAEGASNNARNKKEALAHAEELRAQAQTDFKRAVRDGDVGSADDVGRIPRGVLDPPTEVAVFSLAAGEVSAVLETPKGYWVVKRLD
jgi:hypothetical protein